MKTVKEGDKERMRNESVTALTPRVSGVSLGKCYVLSLFLQFECICIFVPHHLSSTIASTCNPTFGEERY